MGEHAMRKQQQGMTTIGLIILVAFIGMFGFGILQMVPVYLENMRIQQVLNQTKTNLDRQKASVMEIRTALGKGINVESLYDVDANKDFTITRTETGYNVSTEYQREKLFVANVYLVAKFSHEVEIIR